MSIGDTDAMPSAGELECIRLLLGITLQPNNHELGGSLNYNRIKYMYDQCRSCFEEYSAYELDAVYFVLLIHKHCPTSVIGQLPKDILKLILVKCL